MFDWNRAQEAASPPPPHGQSTVPFSALKLVRVVDETLRDGLQTPSATNPPVEQKVDLLHAMAAIGVNVVSVGLPAAGGRNAEDCYRLCKEIKDEKLPMIPTAAARTLAADVEGIAKASQRAGLPIEVYAFVGSSPIRHYVEGWELDFIRKTIDGAAAVARRENLPFCLVTEDTTRSHPDVLRILFTDAIRSGANRFCLCDTTGHVTPYGVEELVLFVRSIIEEHKADIELDWHGHNDRGLALPTALWAASNGVNRVHGTGLGIGERVGNAGLELLVHNLGLLRARPLVPIQKLRDYCQLVARALDWEVPLDHPFASARAQSAGTYRPYRNTPTRVAESPDRLIPIRLRIGGSENQIAVPARRTLLEALRYDMDLVGTKQGCDKGDCGACTVILNGRAVLSCLTLAVDADGADIQTVETLKGAPELDPLLSCFDEVGGGQCGFCTPGMLMSATALLDRNSSPTRGEIKKAISGNLCRCTGYGRIVDAIEMAAAIRRGEATPTLPMPGTEHVAPPLSSNRKESGGSRNGS